MLTKILSYLKKKITKRRAVVLLIIAAVIAFWRINSARKAILQVEIVKVEKGNLTQSVSASGSIKAGKLANLSFPTFGKVAWLGVYDGQSVKKWQALASLDKTALNASYQQAKSNLRSAEAALDSTYDSLQGKEKTETFAERSTRTTAEVTKDNAYDALLAAEYNLNNSTIIAPFEGIVTNFADGFAQGINVTGLTTIMSVVDPKTVYFEAEVNELDVSKIKIDQSVDIELDAFPDEVFEGSVTNVSFISTTSSTGGTVYKVKISLTENKDLKFRYGMEGSGMIILDTLENVLLVPSSAIVETDGVTYVWVDENSKAVKKPVEIGSLSLENTEIKSGLKENESVIILPPVNIKEGLRIKST